MKGGEKESIFHYFCVTGLEKHLNATGDGIVNVSLPSLNGSMESEISLHSALWCLV